MREHEFEEWLRRHYRTRAGKLLGSGSRSSTLSNCRRVDRHEGDLDRHFSNDGLAGVLGRLADRSAGIVVQGNRDLVFSSLKSAVALYEQFCRDWPPGGRPTTPPASAEEVEEDARRPRGRRAEGTARWPEWERPSANDILELARAVARHARFLAPDIVKAVVQDNEKHRLTWAEALDARGIDADRYCWARSACTFPGVRRYVGSAEIARHRKKGAEKESTGHLQDALVTDDNAYPKHLWSFVLRGRPFQQFGPDGYALAHLLDHKDYKNRLASELMHGEPLGERAPFGLFTCASNTAYLPRGLIRPTDHAALLRGLLQRRALALYGEFCNLVPPPARLSDAPSDEWQVSSFEWADPVQAIEPIERFLAWREARVGELLEARAPVRGSSGGTSAESREDGGALAPATLPGFEVSSNEAGSEVEVWSTYRLQFNSTPRTRALKSAISDHVRSMVPSTGFVEALYTSASTDDIDVENILLYNVGPGSFRHLASEGLRFERLHGTPPDCPVSLSDPAQHYHRYRTVPVDQESSIWRAGSTAWSVKGLRIPALSEASKPSHVWLAACRAAVVPATTLDPAQPYLLKLTLRTESGRAVRPAAICKVLVDGIVCALHAHDGSDLDVLVPRLARQLEINEHEARAWLLRDERHAVLGARRLLWPRADGFQWNPADDTLVSCTLRHQQEATSEGWGVDVEVAAAISIQG